jgi:8-oxo-dGTP pyrophosphatase MutT (NUDIX family)
MTLSPSGDARVVRIAAALIVDQTGQMLLVRKRGTQAFMQAGGKIEASESPREALSRELTEELRIDLESVPYEFIGHFAARAAHEEDHVVSADIFYVQIPGTVTPAAEIEEIVWIDPFGAQTLPLAPLTRDLVPIAQRRLAISSGGNS